MVGWKALCEKSDYSEVQLGCAGVVIFSTRKTSNYIYSSHFFQKKKICYISFLSSWTTNYLFYVTRIFRQRKPKKKSDYLVYFSHGSRLRSFFT